MVTPAGFLSYSFSTNKFEDIRISLKFYGKIKTFGRKEKIEEGYKYIQLSSNVYDHY